MLLVGHWQKGIFFPGLLDGDSIIAAYCGDNYLLRLSETVKRQSMPQVVVYAVWIVIWHI